MKLRTLTALAALALTAACANEAAMGERNTGTALEGATPEGNSSAPAPAVTVDTVQPGRTSTTTDPSVVQATDVTTTPDSAAKAQMGGTGGGQTPNDSAAPAAHP